MNSSGQNRRAGHYQPCGGMGNGPARTGNTITEKEDTVVCDELPPMNNSGYFVPAMQNIVLTSEYSRNYSHEVAGLAFIPGVRATTRFPIDMILIIL
ncbi:MAG: hypothetical protein WCB46_07105 [Methanoregula sp.]